MEQLNARLEAIQRKRTSDAVWGAFDSACCILADFREQVQKEALPLSGGEAPHFIYDPCRAPLPEGATFGPADWVRYSDFVLGIIRASTGMNVAWPGPGAHIELHLTKPGISPPPELRDEAQRWAGGEAQRPSPSETLEKLFGGGGPGLLGMSALREAIGREGLRPEANFGGTLTLDGNFGLKASFSPSEGAPPASAPAPTASERKAPSSRPDNVCCEPAPSSDPLCASPGSSCAPPAPSGAPDTSCEACKPCSAPPCPSPPAAPVTVQFTGTGTILTPTG